MSSPSSAPPDLVAFCDEMYPRLVRMLSLYTGDVHVAEELAQEALVRASSRWSQVATYDRPDAWVLRVARNLATSAWRRRQAARRAATRDGRPDVTSEPVDVATVHTVREALARLSAADREVLVLRHHLDWSVADVAEELRISESAVRSRTKRAADRLRDELRESADA